MTTKLKDDISLYDKRGIPILPGDVVKVFHYVAWRSRKKIYMYKMVLEIMLRGEALPPLMKFANLPLTRGHYYHIMDGSVLKGYEIVAGGNNDCDFRDRVRKTR